MAEKAGNVSCEGCGIVPALGLQMGPLRVQKLFFWLTASQVTLQSTALSVVFRNGCTCSVFRTSHVSLPTSAVNAPSLAHICRDAPLSYLDGFAREGLSNIYHDPILGPQCLSEL